MEELAAIVQRQNLESAGRDLAVDEITIAPDTWSGPCHDCCFVSSYKSGESRYVYSSYDKKVTKH